MMNTEDHVIVDDGTCIWAADRDDLLAAMEDGGWQRGERTMGGTLWTAPEDGYSLLCAAVAPQAGEGSDTDLTEHDLDSLPRMTWRQDWGQRSWDLDDAREV